MQDESHDVHRPQRGHFGAVLSTFLAICLATAACMVTLQAYWQRDTLTMIDPQEFFYLPYPPDPIDCASDRFEFARSLDQLPGKIRYGNGTLADIADFGQDYDGGRGPSGLPTHRFAGAAVGHKHIFVVVEGVLISTVSHDVIWDFERQDARWVGHTVFGGGSTVQEILASVCWQPKWVAHSTVGDIRIDCDVDPRGRIAIQYGNARHSDIFAARTRGQGQWRTRREDIRHLYRPDRLSPDELADMRRMLQTLQPSLKEDEGCHFLVGRFLEALTATPREPGSGEP